MRRKKIGPQDPAWYDRAREAAEEEVPEIDPALAHLYGLEDPDSELEIPTRAVSMDSLLEATALPEVLSDHDLEELALLVRDAQNAGTSSDEFLASLELGSFRPVIVCALCPEGPEAEIHEGPADTENLHLFEPLESLETYFDLNPNGLRVTRRIAELEGLIPRGAGGPA